MVDPHARETFHRRDQQSGTAIGVTGVDLVVPVALDGDVGVTWDADDVDPPSIGGKMKNHDRVGALRALLARTPVRADEQPVLRLAHRLAGALGLDGKGLGDPPDVPVIDVLSLHQQGESTREHHRDQQTADDHKTA
ncbi:hypothetical protein GCM10020219_061860 [Nonomuraea dietziae]